MLIIAEGMLPGKISSDEITESVGIKDRLYGSQNDTILTQSCAAIVEEDAQHNESKAGLIWQDFLTNLFKRLMNHFKI